MAKSKGVGRPKGPEKEPINVFINCDGAKKLRDLAKKEQKTISIMVENALQNEYSI